MKILIVSHTCFSTHNNMGKTLLSYFRGFAPEELAQLYFHRETPAETACCRYYRFTDGDALKSLFTRREQGESFGLFTPDEQNSNGGGSALSFLYRWGQRRTAMVHCLRNLLWKCSRWETRRLWQWIEDFSPDAVFFAAGDYSFSYEIAARIAKARNIPLLVCCVDDFYLHNRNADSILGSFLHRRFLKRVFHTMDQVQAVFVICESLKREYEVLFDRPCYLLHTPAVPYSGTPEQTNRIAYIGNLELKREESLVQLGRTLQMLEIPGIPKHLDVYSGEEDSKILKHMTMENGIRFHGPLPGEQVQAVMASCLAVIHTESFRPKMQAIVRHSVSAKIPDALQNGPCLIAYGPAGIASMDYLLKTGAAYCITDPEKLRPQLEIILSNEALRRKIVARARAVAAKNHNPYGGSDLIRQVLEEVCDR
ncbi:MAG: glycosyltransferase [Oscillospiraceae bacterium]|nr:glycosyltransferase [Oscillospiraceae bacterium]